MDTQPAATDEALERIAFTLERIGGLLDEICARLRRAATDPVTSRTPLAGQSHEEAGSDQHRR